jgi:hypothetical protein
MSAEFHARIIRAARGIMGTYARQWRAAARDYTQADYATERLAKAVEWRDKARRWKEIPA